VAEFISGSLSKGLREELLAVTEASEKRLLLTAPLCAACEAKAWRVGTLLEAPTGACIAA